MAKYIIYYEQLTERLCSDVVEAENAEEAKLKWSHQHDNTPPDQDNWIAIKSREYLRRIEVVSDKGSLVPHPLFLDTW